MTAETGLIFFISLLLLWIKPGPSQAFKLTYALEYGFLKAFLVTMGGVTVSLGYFLFVALGYQAVLTISNNLLLFLKALGAIYLIYLGVKSLTKKKNNPSNDLPDIKQKRGYLKDFSLGFLMAISNPITIFYYIGILPGLVPVGALELSDVVAGLSLIFLACIIVDGLLILLTVMSKEALSGGRLSKYVTMGAGLSFIAIGGFLLYSALFLPDGLFYSLT